MKFKAILTFLLVTSFVAAEFPVEFVNNTGIANDDEIYIIAKGLDPSGSSCYVKVKPDGSAVCEKVRGDTKSTDYSYKLSEVKKINFPYMASGRIYISIGQPMHFRIDSEGERLIAVDADGFKPRDPNYYTLYDKVEFSYVEGGTWMNPTAVDFFALPLRIEQAGSHVYQATGLSFSREDILEQFKTIIKAEDLTPTREWDKISLNYTKNKETTLLRIMSPGKAMLPGIPGTNPMDLHYLDSYIDKLWEYYKTHTLIIDCSELAGTGYKLDNYLFIGKVEGNDFVFTNPQDKVVIPRPENSIPWFAGAQGVFDAPNNTPKAIIVRQLSSAFDVGLLPAEDGTVLNRAFFDKQRDKRKYYSKNPLLPTSMGGPWFDLYSMALHSFGEDQPIYTFAYDDALGQDGTLHDPNTRNISKAVITIGDLSGTHIPRPFEDLQQYEVSIIIGSKSQVLYQGRVLKTGDVLSQVSVPLKVELNGQPADIYFDPAIVLPTFKEADGVVIEKSGEKVNLIFPGR